MMKNKFNIRLQQQPSGCPQSNSLDQMVWKCSSTPVTKMLKDKKHDGNAIWNAVLEVFRNNTEGLVRKMHLTRYVLEDTAKCAVEDGGLNDRRNGDHRGARKRQKEEIGQEGLEALDAMRHDAHDPDIGGPICEDDGTEGNEDEHRRPPPGTKEALLIGRVFQDKDEVEELGKTKAPKWRVGDVRWMNATEGAEWAFQGWVAHYYPAKKRKYPGADD